MELDAVDVFASGVWRAVIGSAAVSNPDFVQKAVAEFGPERIAVGIDAKDGLVRTAGWAENAGIAYLSFARQMESIGVKYIIFTDIDTDGTLSGPAFHCLEALQRTVSCSITASGGVSSANTASRSAIDRMPPPSSIFSPVFTTACTMAAFFRFPSLAPSRSTMWR